MNSSSALGLVQKIPLIAVCILVAAPLLMLLRSWLLLDEALWQHLWQTQLLELIKNTLILLVGVGVGVAFLGVLLAWLTAVCEFPGRRFFSWALILPLAIPAYVLAFVTLGIYDFGGAIQVGLRALGYQGYFDARHPLMVVWVMTAVLYPYVYLLVRVSFLHQGTYLLSVARTLGRSPVRAFFEVVLPAVRPALVAGMSLALMEALSDFGAVSIFGYNTFTTAIYKSWLSLFSLNTAAQLATLLLLFVMICLYGERASRKDIFQRNGGAKSDRQPIVLSGGWKWLASAFCSFILLLTVVAPFIQLLVWAQSQWASFFDPHFFWLLLRTFTLGVIAAVLVICLSVAISVSRSAASGNRSKSFRFATEFAGMGYALPGSVLAIGLMLCFSVMDSAYLQLGQILGRNWHPVFLGSLAGLITAFVIRFFRPGFGAVESGFDAIQKNYMESAELMAVSKWSRFRRITLPLILPGMLTGALIVFVDVIKEMPATLLLRPFGWDTLSVKLYELTSEGQWQLAAVPAILLVLVSLGPVVMLIRRSQLSGRVSA